MTAGGAGRDAASAAGGRILVIDCVTPALSLALFDGDGACLAGRHDAIGRGHAEALLPAIAALPDRGRADRILVDIGPGSFTGVRVGLAAARALAFAWGASLAGYGCLDLVAAGLRASAAPPAPFVVAMIGGHGELFWQRFPADPAQDDPAAVPRSGPVATLAAEIGDAVVYGSGAPALVAARGHGSAVPLLPDARQALLLAPALRARPAAAAYGRGADARPMTARPVAQAPR